MIQKFPLNSGNLAFTDAIKVNERNEQKLQQQKKSISKHNVKSHKKDLICKWEQFLPFLRSHVAKNFTQVVLIVST